MNYFFILILCAVQALAGTLNLSGSIISDNQKTISSRYMGYVRDIPVAEGDVISQGDLLFAIDSKEIDSQKSQAELAISQAKLALSMLENQHANTKRNVERYRRLLKQDMVSRFEVENLELHAKNLRAQMEITKQQVAQAEAQLKTVLNQYSYLNVTAPNDGVIVSRRIKAGEMAIPGVPLVTLSDLKSLKIEAEINESNLKDATFGKEVKIEIPSLGLQTTGVISAIIPSSNPTTHTFRIKISFDSEDKNIYPGMFAAITLKTD